MVAARVTLPPKATPTLGRHESIPARMQMIRPLRKLPPCAADFYIGSPAGARDRTHRYAKNY